MPQGCWTLVVCNVELLGCEGKRHSEKGTTSYRRQVSDTKISKIGKTDHKDVRCARHHRDAGP